MANKNTYAVFGLGRYGTAVAKELVNNGEEVLAVDIDEEKVNESVAEIPFCKCADVAYFLSRKGFGSIERTCCIDRHLLETISRLSK